MQRVPDFRRRLAGLCFLLMLALLALLAAAAGCGGGQSSGIITTVAGDGNQNYDGDNVLATSTTLNNPRGVVVDSSGNQYIADTNNNRVRKVTASTGIITTFAGNGTRGYSGDSGQAASAELYYPMDVVLDGNGNLYISDYGNNVVRKVVISSGVITTVAGNYTLGAGYSGDSGAATSAQLSSPVGIAVTSAGDLYIADLGNAVVRKVTASSGVITTVAGNYTLGAGFAGDGGAATSAQLNNPIGVALDSSSNLYIADESNQRIRKVTTGTGIITTFAGSGTQGFSGDGGNAGKADFNDPTGIVLDSSGNLYVSDTGNQRIRLVAGGKIRTIAGDGDVGLSGDGDRATSATFNNPQGLALHSGNLYVADVADNVIRKISPAY